jgi:hypothetical protein
MKMDYLRRKIYCILPGILRVNIIVPSFWLVGRFSDSFQVILIVIIHTICIQMWWNFVYLLVLSWFAPIGEVHCFMSLLFNTGFQSALQQLKIVCDVTLSVYPHRASLKNMPGHGGNRTYDLHIFQARPVWIYTQSNITNIIFTWVHNTNTEKTLKIVLFIYPRFIVVSAPCVGSRAPAQKRRSQTTHCRPSFFHWSRISCTSTRLWKIIMSSLRRSMQYLP